MRGLTSPILILITWCIGTQLQQVAVGEVQGINVTMAPIVYSKHQLMDIKASPHARSYHDLTSLRKLGICVSATHRGCRGSGHSKPIQSFATTNRTADLNFINSVNPANLTVVKQECENALKYDKHMVSFGLLNARSVKNKANEIKDHIIDNNLDVVAITETWMTNDSRMVEGDVCPGGYQMIHTPRIGRRGGGVALIIKSSLKCKHLVSQHKFQSFEHQTVDILMNGGTVTLIIIYRPPPSSKYRATPKEFNEEFSHLLEENVSRKLLVVGDFNFHIDIVDNQSSKDFLETSQSFNLIQHVGEPTHKSGHTLDLIFSRADDALIDTVTVRDTGISDHFWVECLLLGPKPKTFRKVITHRKLKKIDIESLKTDILESRLSEESMDTCEKAVKVYNNVLTDLLDKHAPAVTSSVIVHPETPWYNEEINTAKKARRQAENTWRKTKLLIHREIFLNERNRVNYLVQKAKESYYIDCVTSSSSQKQLFKVVNELTNNKNENVLPDHTSTQELADRFSHFFETKITDLRSKLDDKAQDLPDSDSEPHANLSATWDEFEPVSIDEMKEIFAKKSTTCRLDPIPTT